MVLNPTLGTGLFIGSGQALAAGGPASLLLSFSFISVLVYCLTTAVAEISAHMPEKGGTLVTHAYRYSSNHMAFSMGYLRWYSLAMLVPFEITNAIVHVGMWIPGPAVAIRVSIITAIIFLFNLLPERAFKRSEAFFSGLKYVTTGGLAIVSVALAIRGVPGTGIRGFSYWNNPGAMNEYLISGPAGRFLGLLQCLLYSAVSFIFQPELTVHRAEEVDSKVRPSIFSVARIDNIQLVFMYIISAVSVGLMSPFTEPSLTNSGLGAGFSPYMIGIRNSQLPVLPIVATITILLSSVASGRSFLYLSSRTLCTLSESGHAPALFQARTRWGVPYVAVITSALFSGFAYLSLATSSSVVFNWLMHFITTSGYISWLGACVSYLQFRRATETQGFAPVYRARIQPYGAYFGIASCTLLPLINGIIVAAPSQLTASKLIPAYLGIPTYLLLYFGHQARDAITRRNVKTKEVSIEQGGNVVEEPSRQDEGKFEIELPTFFPLDLDLPNLGLPDFDAEPRRPGSTRKGRT
ncbi:hypothetical protein ASPWEDRAFT_44234 [Aspergillus wentii DTO 134E9]|uniref:Amino acid permease/ SLC12A domain-containing protein n=1 Tax=Aspergillus wentii DTO 134E9 TaxID=1073089 RepID=A0A1L9RB54_ASPWE|nr:uncharacterized protein ASPWEDRAFT_44234 [Aspergillus wentii DTO 134E9]KAI9934741.1 hypothetical protein MW887_000358 [Aspergillus wentii]OJJ32166.1 hypothetical protein ASPWEDRAFT_44234 [Aspergillus wentii DTO 134E9]